MTKQRGRGDLERSVAKLSDLTIELVRRIRAETAELEDATLTTARFALMHALFHHGPERMNTIAKRLHVVPRTLTTLVDALEGEGYVERIPDDRDGRAFLLCLTTRGFEMLRRARRGRLAHVRMFFSSLDDAERDQLATLLAKALSIDAHEQATPSSTKPRRGS